MRPASAVRGPASARSLLGKLFPQWLRTLLVVTLWLGTVPIYVSLIAPYVAYKSAIVMAVGLAIFSGFAPHLWPSRTSPWRTVAWAWLCSTLTGMLCLSLGWGRYSVMLVTLVGFGIVAGRANQNARKLVGLVSTWRAMR